MRVLLDTPPYHDQCEKVGWMQRGVWPCEWVYLDGADQAPFVSAYRRRFELTKAATIRAHVSADERYELFLDGERIGRGPERGDARNWFFETYDLDLAAGVHTIVARVWSLGSIAPVAQMSLHPGFIFSHEGEYVDLLGTGVAEWEGKRLGGYRYDGKYGFIGANYDIEGDSYCWGFERGEGEGWGPVRIFQRGADAKLRVDYAPAHLMKPSMLPAMIEKECRPGRVRFVSAAASLTDVDTTPVRGSDNLASELDHWNLIGGGKSVVVPPHTIRRVLFDLDDYFCAYPSLTVSGGAGSHVHIGWAESLFHHPENTPHHENSKGNRGEIEGKYFFGSTDLFHPDGGAARTFEPLWWKSGRYVQMLVETADEALTIESLKLRETRYPLEMETSFHADDPRLEAVIPIALRGMQMCSHETYMDCPYYEQLMYAGDSRLEALTTYVMTKDDRLPLKCLRTFDMSRLQSGLTQSRYPARITQIIPPFSLWWIAMVHDYAHWRDDVEEVRNFMPGVRSVTDCFRSFLNADGFIEYPKGWNFMDWARGWGGGIPPEGDFGVNGSINWQTVWVFEMAAELEAIVGEKEMAVRDRKFARALAAKATEAFWDERRGLFAEDLAHSSFSEHVNCLAVLSRQIDPGRRDSIARKLPTDPDLTRTTIYFTHYLFEAYRALDLMGPFFERLGLWFDLEKNGFKTTFESPEPSRSDCHAWGAHPVFHYFASILGIRPASPGFRTVAIEPRLGPLKQASGKLVHPKGLVEVDLRVEDGELRGSVALPKGVKGTVVFGDKRVAIKGGRKIEF